MNGTSARFIAVVGFCSALFCTPLLLGAGYGPDSTVFVILMGNHNWSDILGNPDAPYINGTLLPMASYTDQYYNPPGVHPSEPNYLWLEAGTDFGIRNDNLPEVNHQSTTSHLVTQLKNAGISWKTYQEDITGTSCPTEENYPCAPKHNPFSQSVKSAAEGEERGFHGGKKIKGRSCHVAIDSQGTLLAMHVRAANKADGVEAGAVMLQACERHPSSIESFTANKSYQRQAEAMAREQLGVELHVTAKPKTPKPSRHRRKKGGFQPVRFRWRVERTFAWFGQCRLLSKEYEKTLKSAEASLWCAMMRLLIRRLAV